MAQEIDVRAVLELRVHGVNNTPPAAVLDLPAEDVGEVLGDELAGFWRPKTPEGAPGTGLPNDSTRGHVPDGITREAYSWGGLARRTPGGALSAGSKVIAVLVAAGWTFLLPFGLANVAYWARSLDTSGPAESITQRASAFLVRLFGICLTGFLVLTVCEVSMDLVATQCYQRLPGESDATMVCSRLPGLLGGLAKVGLSVRLVAFAVVPLALLVGLWLLSSMSRSRYERAAASEPPGEPQLPGSVAAAGPAPILSRPDMWRGDVMVKGLAHLHLATGLALVVVCLAFPVVTANDPVCHGRPRRQCLHDVAALHDAKPYLWIALVVALLLLVAIAVAAFVRASDSPDIHGEASDPRGVLLLAAIVLLVYVVLAMLITHPDIDGTVRLPGVSSLPTVVLALMVGLAAGACILRLEPWLAWSLAIAVAALVGLIALDKGLVALGAVLLTAIVLAAFALPHMAPRRYTTVEQKAWAEAAPGVFMGMALLAQGVLSAFVVLLAGDWLNGSNGASTLSPRERAAPAPPTFGPCHQLCPGQDPFLTVPTPYLLLGGAGVLAVLVLGGGVAFEYWLSGRDPVAAPNVPEGFEKSLRSARRFARVAHRAEGLVGLLVKSGLLLVLAATIISAADLLQWKGAPGTQPPPAQRVLDLSTALVAALGAATLGALVKGASSGTRRPLGLVWDLVSFLPRAAHPFAPPCYAERAVPELSDRVAWWLAQPGLVVAGQRRGGTRVVLSAHSLGGVLAVAALMRTRLLEFEEIRAIRLLTYGSQLRAYFGRIFPELLGPEVLGTPPARRGSPWSPDPWREEESGPLPIGDLDPWSVTARLSQGGGTTLWRNLWRLTDYIGFPVDSFVQNPVDGPADESDESGYLRAVLTHSNYPRTQEYREALTDLAARP